MVTAFLDLHGNLPGVNLNSPLLYPLSSQAKAFWLSYGSGPLLANRLRDLGKDMVFKLQRNHSLNWQLIVLVDLPAGGRRLMDPILVDQIHAVQQHVLPILRKRKLSPRRLTVLAIDPLDRDHRDMPLHLLARLRWKLCLHGMAWLDKLNKEDDPEEYAAIQSLIEQHPFLFTEADIQELDQLWPTLELPERARIDQRVAHLPEAFRAKLNEAWQATASHIDALIELKKEWGATFSDQGSIFTNPDQLADILENYKALLSEEDTVSVWLEFRPGQALREILRKKLGLAGIYHNLSIIRFPLPQAPPISRQKGLLGLQYFLATLTETVPGMGPLTGELQKAHQYKAHVQLFEPAIAEQLKHYHERLDRAGKNLNVSLARKDQAELLLLDEVDCSCNEPLDDQPMQQILKRVNRLGPISHRDDPGWSAWVNSVDQTLTDQHDLADTVIKTWIRKRHSQPDRPKLRQLDDTIENSYPLFETAFQKARTALMTTTLHPFKNSWRADVSDHSGTTRAFLQCRPTWRVLLICWFVSFFIFFAPYFIAHAGGNPNTPVWQFSLWPVLTVLTTLLSSAILLFLIRRRLHKHIRTAKVKAQQVYSGLRNHFELRKHQLTLACQSRTALHNYKMARQAFLKAEKHMMRLKYHSTQIDRHRQTTQQLHRITPNVSTLSNPSLIPHDLAPNTDLPVHSNPLYWFTHSATQSPCQVRINMATFEIRSSMLNGVEAIEISAL